VNQKSPRKADFISLILSFSGGYCKHIYRGDDGHALLCISPARIDIEHGCSEATELFGLHIVERVGSSNRSALSGSVQVAYKHAVWLWVVRTLSGLELSAHMSAPE